MFEDFNSGNWKDILERLALIREQQDYSGANVDFIREQLQSDDDRIRGGSAIAASGCVFEPYIIDLLLEMTENEQVEAIRKACIQSLGDVIHEGVMRNFEDERGPDTDIEFYEEWDELQNETLQEDYLRVKNALFSILQDEYEQQSIRETSLSSVSDLGFIPEVQEWISEFINYKTDSAQLVALHSMGKYPYLWIDDLLNFLDPQKPKHLLMEAISSSYSSQSAEIAEKIENLLETDDPDIISYAVLTLANINRTENLGQILQHFLHHSDEQIRNAAHEALRHYSQRGFNDFLEDELGLEDFQ